MNAARTAARRHVRGLWIDRERATASAALLVDRERLPGDRDRPGSRRTRRGHGELDGPVARPASARRYRYPAHVARRGPRAACASGHAHRDVTAGRVQLLASRAERDCAARRLRNGDLDSGDGNRPAAPGSGNGRDGERDSSASGAGRRACEGDPRRIARRRPSAPGRGRDRRGSCASLRPEGMRKRIDREIAAGTLSDRHELTGDEHAARPSGTARSVNHYLRGTRPGAGRPLYDRRPRHVARCRPRTARGSRDVHDRGTTARRRRIARGRDRIGAALRLRDSETKAGHEHGARARRACCRCHVVHHGAVPRSARARSNCDPAGIGHSRPGAHPARCADSDRARATRRGEALRRVRQLHRAIGRGLGDVRSLIVQLDHAAAAGGIAVRGRGVFDGAVSLPARRSADRQPRGRGVRRPRALSIGRDGNGALPA